MKRWLASLLVLATACAPSAVGPAAATPQASPSPTAFPIEKITFIAGFKPQANLPFVGVYVAQERGYFKAQGLEVAIQHAVSGEHVQLLATGRAQFSTGSGGDILKRVSQADVPLVSIALIGQRDEQAFAVRADSPISTLKDWEGKLVGYKSTPSADYLALLKIGGVDRSKVREVAVGFDPRVLATGQVDVYPVFASNEPDTLARQGVAVRLFDPTAYGIPSFGLSRAKPKARERPVGSTLHRLVGARNDRMVTMSQQIGNAVLSACGLDRLTRDSEGDVVQRF